MTNASKKRLNPCGYRTSPSSGRPCLSCENAASFESLFSASCCKGKFKFKARSDEIGFSEFSNTALSFMADMATAEFEIFFTLNFTIR